MAVTNEQIFNYLKSNPGMSDAQIAADMDKYGVTPEQMAAATGVNAAAVQGRYDTVKAVNAFGDTKPTSDTAWATKMADEGWSPEDISRVTGIPLREVNARYQTATELNRVNTDMTGLRTQLGVLQNAYDSLKTQTPTTPITPTAPTNTSFLGGGAPNVIPTVTGSTGAATPAPTAPTATSGVVYGPDGTMYSSAAAAIAAGVQNYSTTKPAGVISGANTLSGQFINSAKASTGNVNSGGLIGNAQQQLFKNPVGAQTPGVANPFLIKS